MQYVVEAGNSIPLLAQAVWGFYESRDPECPSAKIVAVLRNRYGGHPLKSRKARSDLRVAFPW
jgi:6-phosphogluconate dehydrogenase (decarboxylating)